MSHHNPRGLWRALLLPSAPAHPGPALGGPGGIKDTLMTEPTPHAAPASPALPTLVHRDQTARIGDALTDLALAVKAMRLALEGTGLSIRTADFTRRTAAPPAEPSPEFNDWRAADLLLREVFEKLEDEARYAMEVIRSTLRLT
jgi:hypothetical protein